jgi:transcriptional regulator with XRE-family HTH domain
MATTVGAPHSTAREILATNMKRLRAERGLSQEDLALECELHRTFIAHVERCGRNISLDNVEKIANALHVAVGDLLTAGTGRS